jgi:hypothetical protein
MSESKQPEALRLAKILETEATHSIALDLEAADELRRQYALNTELLYALQWIADRCPAQLADHPLHDIHKEIAYDAGACARAAIAKVTNTETN